MAVIEELIARLGFETKGLGDLKKFDKALEGAKKNLDGFGKAANKTIGNPLNPMSKMGTQAAQNAKQMTGLQRVMQGVSRVFTAFALGATKVVAILLRTTAIVGSLAIGFAGLAAGIAGVTLLLFRMASAAALAAAKTAKLRREAQLSAKGKGTTAGNIDKVTKGLGLAGVSADDSKSFIEGVAGKANDAILDGDQSAFQKAKTPILDKDGRQIDTSAVATNILARYLDMMKAGREARAKADATKGKARKGAVGKANEAEKAARQFAKDWDISGVLKGAIDDFKGGAAEFIAKMKEAGERNPVPTSAQEDRSKRIAENAAKLEQSIEALSQPFANLRDTIVDSVLPGLVAFGDGLVSIGKKLGLISETAGERDAKAEADRESRRGRALGSFDPPATKAALAEASKGGGSLLGALFGSDVEKARAALKSAADEYKRVKDIRDGQAGKRSPSDQAQWDAHLASKAAELAAAFDRLKSATGADASGPPGFRSESAEAAAAELDKLAAGAGRVSEAIKAWQNIASPTQGAKGLAEQTGDKIENDNRKYENIGNDQRTISPTVNINQTISGMEGAAAAAGAAAKSGVLGAVSSKGANTSTGALTSP